MATERQNPKLDSGHGITLRRTAHHDDRSRHGWIVEHPTADGVKRQTFSGLCEATVRVCGRAECADTHHEVRQEELLTIHPSLGCQICGLHGWIREGRWIPA